MFAYAQPRLSLGAAIEKREGQRLTSSSDIRQSLQHDFYRPDIRFFRALEARTSRMVNRREILHLRHPQIQTCGLSHLEYRQQNDGLTFPCVYNKQKESDNVEVWIVETEHTCFGVRAPKRDAANSQEWLIHIVPKLLTVAKDTTPHHIIDVLCMV